jgi:hypothetical protein
MRRRLAQVGAVLTVLLVLALPGPSAATGQRGVDVFTGYGFETCTAPSLNALGAWAASPYQAVGIYLGGVNRACKDGNLSASWVTTTLSLGWSLLPLYVGLQAPCVSQAGLAKISQNLTTAGSQGAAAADDAIAKANLFGLPPGSPLYADIEGYATNNAACSKVVQAFAAGWVNELHAQGYVAGVYGSAASTIRDVAALGSSIPDAAWIANWNGVEGAFGDPHVSDSLWANHQRVHQYKGGHNETWGGVTLNVDDDYVDGPVVGATGAPAPPPPPPTTTTPGAAPTGGAVGSGDGQAAVSWPVEAFPAPAVVTLTPASQPGAPGYTVQLTATQADTQAPVTRFAAPLTLHLLMQPNGLLPSYSPDGSTWKAIPKLTAGAVPADVGYTVDPDGTVEIQTFVPGFFGLRLDGTPPTQPPAFAGHFTRGALVLQWQGATDDSGTVGSYQVLLDGTPVQKLKGTSRRTVVHAFHAAGLTVYRVRAVDPSGNLGKPSPPVAVRARERPAGVPKALPRWVWPFFAWQHGQGSRPAAAPKKVPAWYWSWAAWRIQPYRLVRG